MILHTNWRGMVDEGTTAFGRRMPCQQPLDCPVIRFPAASYKAYNQSADLVERQTWYGSLIEEKSDDSGLMYMRNRYYNPTTGQFTQEDPIGIAGGLNTYGFANGDPVTYNDPYGLCLDLTKPRCKQWLLLGGAGGATAGLATTAVCAAGTKGICTFAGPQLVAMGAAGGMIAGGTASTLEELGVVDLEGVRRSGVHAMGRGVERLKKLILAVSLALSANPAVPTTPTNPCGDKVRVECEQTDQAQDSTTAKPSDRSTGRGSEADPSH